MSSTPLVRAAAAQGLADLLIYGPIGAEYGAEGITAKAVVEALARLDSAVRTLRVRVNSVGGNPWEAAAIATALRMQRNDQRRTVETYIDGIAASAATVITSAGRPVKIADDAIMMVHLPFALTYGNSDDHQEMARALEVIADSIVAAYRWVSPKSTEELKALMKATTWMDADEAIANGFATEKVGGSQAAAKTSAPAALLDRIGAIPDRFRARGPVATSDAPLSSAAIYAARNARPQTEASTPAPTAAAARVPTFAEIAAQVYGPPQAAAAGGLIQSSERGAR